MLGPLPDLSRRLKAEEWMDDASLERAAVGRALADLRWINRYLGGYRATLAHLSPLLRRRSSIRILDLGCGGGDYLSALARRSAALDCDADLVGIDASAPIVGHAQAHLDQTLPPKLRSRVQVKVGDALDLSFAAATFDVAHAALFLHHLHGEETIRLLQSMDRVSRLGLVVNDLHRDLLAYAGIWGLSRLARLSPIVQHDGPLSVRRGFRRSELRTLAETAGLPAPSIRWHWAFRWTVSTLPDHNP